MDPREQFASTSNCFTISLQLCVALNFHQIDFQFIRFDFNSKLCSFQQASEFPSLCLSGMWLRGRRWSMESLRNHCPVTGASVLTAALWLINTLMRNDDAVFSVLRWSSVQHKHVLLHMEKRLRCCEMWHNFETALLCFFLSFFNGGTGD